MNQKTIRHRAARRWGTGLLSLLAVLSCLVATPASAATVGKHPHRHHARPLYWGAIIGPQLTGHAAPWDLTALDKFERLVHKKASLLGFSSPFADCSQSPCTFYPFPTAAMESLRQQGTVPILSWATQSVPSSLKQPDFQLAKIAAGRYDTYIESFAEQAAEWNRPFFLRLNPEMNGFWFPWSPGVNGNSAADFVAAWRHIHDIFTRVGATKATWVWCPNVDFERRLEPLRSLYPGNAYVDWTCLDGFNWGDTRNSSGWMSFSQIYRSTYRRVVRIAPHKPMLIGEVASDNRGGSKPAWIRNTLRIVPSHFRRVRGLVWYDENDQGMHWTLERDQASRRAFAHSIRRKIYRPNVFSELPPTPIRPPGPALAANP